MSRGLDIDKQEDKTNIFPGEPTNNVFTKLDHRLFWIKLMQFISEIHRHIPDYRR